MLKTDPGFFRDRKVLEDVTLTFISTVYTDGVKISIISYKLRERKRPPEGNLREWAGGMLGNISEATMPSPGCILPTP